MLKGDPALAARLAGAMEGEVLFDAFSRGRYATDASIYQVEPIGVAVPKNSADVEAAIAIAREQDVPVLPRGAGTSQCGQTVGEALVLDVSKHMNRVVDLDTGSSRVRVQPGIVLDQLNLQLKPHGLYFPVDVSPSNRATIGGMAGNNSCGARSIRYGNMVHNVCAIDAVLADGTRAKFEQVPGNLAGLPDTADGARYLGLVQRMRALHEREAGEIERRFPKLLRRVGGYNIDSICGQGHNMAHMLVGSEGTLGFFTEIELALSPLPRHRVLGVCHFPSFYASMAATQHIVKLNPSAVELVDRTLMELARDIAMFRPTLERYVKAEPQALLLVEFAGDDRETQLRALDALDELMRDLGYSDPERGSGLVQVADAAGQSAIWDVRKAGLNIMMSMKGDGKPVSFVEDCAVQLEDLAEYTRRLDEVFARHGTSGTWYAHASVGTLHVRPIINLKEPAGAKQMRAIAEDCFEMVREYKGSHSGEHGDGLVRSEFHEPMFGARLVRAFEEVKDSFDPDGLFNPGKIVRSPKMDDQSLFRYTPDYAPIPIETALDWSQWGGFDRAVEMCNNNGTCRKASAGVMCPSYRATRDEKHVTRGRANALRLAITGQLGADALTSDEMYAAMDLCVGCKGCKRECPTGVDMARMKTEFLYHYRQRHGLPLKDRLIAYLPRYAPAASCAAPLLNLRDRLPGLAGISEAALGLSAKRSLPHWRADPFGAADARGWPDTGRAGRVALFVDTFSRWFEPENPRAAMAVLARAGYGVVFPVLEASERPLCCGRTFLAAGLVDEARFELRRTLAALGPLVAQNIPILGLEPSCLLTLRDELQALLPSRAADALAERSMLFEEFVANEHGAGRFELPLRPLRGGRALVHGHCHQKAFGLMGAMERTLSLIPGLEVSTIDSSCCGMAGAFGYEAEHFEVSMQMAEASLLPAVRAASDSTIVVANGTSCRHQITQGGQRRALHAVRVLADASAGAQ